MKQGTKYYKCQFCGQTQHTHQRITRIDNSIIFVRNSIIPVPSCLVGKRVKITVIENER